MQKPAILNDRVRLWETRKKAEDRKRVITELEKLADFLDNPDVASTFDAIGREKKEAEKRLEELTVPEGW